MRTARLQRIVTGSRRSRCPASRVGATLSGVALALLLVSSAAAHDFWIEPTAHHAEPAKPIALRLLIGHGTERSEYHRNPRHIRSFTVATPKGTVPVTGIRGGPGGLFTPRHAGLHTFAYVSNPSLTQLEPDAFQAYLAEEGLAGALAQVKGEPPPKRPIRELFTRCAKALVTVGGSSKGGHAERMGLDLELVPLVDPFALKPGGRLSVLLLRAGVPLANARVSAYRRDAPEVVIHARTGADGRAALVLDKPGRWLVKSVAIARAGRRSGADWQSHWATLTFALPAAKPVAPTSPARD